MTTLSRMLELAGITVKSQNTKQLHEYTLEELEIQRNALSSELKGCTILTEHVSNIKYKLKAVEDAITAYGNRTIVEAKDGADFQDSQPTAASGKDEVGNLFDGHDEESETKEKDDQTRMGITQDRETKVVVPKDVMSQINQRIKELKDSIEMYDKTTYVEQYSNKQKAIENLEFIREKLKMGNMEGFKQAQVHYGTLASIFAGNLFPAKLVDFLHDGQGSEKKEVAFADYMKGNSDKPTEGDIPGSAIYKTLDTSIYPQKGEDNVPKQ
jgi:hypothetical protein